MTTPALLLLAPDDVTLYPPGAADERGWVQPGTVPAWTGTGNLQLAPGVSDPRAETGGGFGPFNPARVEGGVLYLPPEANPVDGMTAECRSQRWGLSQTRLVLDPTGGALTCWAATATRDDVLGYGDG
jgi:hypothetical protein